MDVTELRVQYNQVKASRRANERVTRGRLSALAERNRLAELEMPPLKGVVVTQPDGEEEQQE